jgi:D-glycero-beta-D-manno-heptose 1-phosphate adenylyltransferase
VESQAIAAKLLQLKELTRVSRTLAAEDRRLVLTNGCFDLLHVGHVRYLLRARALGHALAVGLNTDASVRKIKGPGRPVTPQNERAEILSALVCVDYVTFFDDETAERLVSEVRPQVYVKGGDYSANPQDPSFPVEGHIVRSYGGFVRIVEYVPRHSTTELLNRLCGATQHHDKSE